MGGLRLAVCAALGAIVAVFAASVSGVVAASPGGLALSVGSATQDTSTPFDVTLSVTRADQTWALYNAEIAYDTTVLKVNSVTRLPFAQCNDANWAAPQTTPTIVVACVFQSSTATGAASTITFQCLKDGSSELHLVTPAEDSINGSTLSDENAEVIPTDLTDGPTITCGVGGPVQTVAIPTNPTGADVETAVAGSPIPAPTGGSSPAAGTPGAAETSVAQGTPAAGGTSTAGTPLPAAIRTQAAAATGTAAKAPTVSGPARTSTALAVGSGSGGSSSGGSSNTGLIIVIVVIVVALAAGGGWLFWKRQQAGP